jgi:AraC-like DNA-binding protein/quercetin dioxygenase-like cupin family protein
VSDQYETETQRAKRLALVETASDHALVYAHRYAPDCHVSEHEHSRAQLLHPVSGVVIVTTRIGRWLVPPDHALWIPAGIRHAVDMIGSVEMHSAYLKAETAPLLPLHLHVTGMTLLMRSLIEQAIDLGPEASGRRAKLILELLVLEIAHLPARPLGLPLPTHAALTRLCREFITTPSARLEINHWAERAGMSRRTFTRLFRQQTGLSLSAWRQQACVMAALPKLTAGESVTGVALDLGYESIAAFTTMFARVLGAPPKTYLRSQNAG